MTNIIRFSQSLSVIKCLYKSNLIYGTKKGINLMKTLFLDKHYLQLSGFIHNEMFMLMKS